jgi:2-dehydro-3-deoxyglucarate aldolase
MNKLLSIKNIRERMKDGKVSIGSWMQLKDSSVAEIMGSSSFDWVAVDMEHGAISHQQLPDLFRALELGGTLPLARVAEGTMLDCKQALDAGAGGVIVPMIETAKDLATIRDACRWPPSGNRGVAFSRANLFGKNFDAYREEAQSPLLVAMIENIHAFNNIEEILSVKGLDAILIGPYDLSASLGITAEFDHPDFIATMGQILRSALDANIPAGIHVVAPLISELKVRIDEGYLFIPYSIDTVMLRNEVEKIIGGFGNERRGY